MKSPSTILYSQSDNHTILAAPPIDPVVEHKWFPNEAQQALYCPPPLRPPPLLVVATAVFWFALKSHKEPPPPPSPPICPNCVYNVFVQLYIYIYISLCDKIWLCVLCSSRKYKN